MTGSEKENTTPDKSSKTEPDNTVRETESAQGVSLPGVNKTPISPINAQGAYGIYCSPGAYGILGSSGVYGTLGSSGYSGITGSSIIRGDQTFSTNHQVTLTDEVVYLKSLNKADDEIKRLSYHISEEAARKLISPEFKDYFKHGSEYETVVVSIDIRRSTELMLKAISPAKFASFIIEIRRKLIAVVLRNYGIYDKFTGDGILAFFPTFYSGEDALLHALRAATECHQVFNEYYNENKSSFTVFLKDIGLGIGIDYGKTTLLNEDGELTVVGTPVVYACRMSGTQAGNTVLNIQAKEHLEKLYPLRISTFETEIMVKNEGLATCFIVKINDEGLEIKKPTWASK